MTSTCSLLNSYFRTAPDTQDMLTTYLRKEGREGGEEGGGKGPVYVFYGAGVG